MQQMQRKKLVESVYQRTDFGWPKDSLGFELDFGMEKDKPDCIMHQTRYIKEMLERYPVEGRPLPRALYGLKQSPMAWYLNLLKGLVAAGWIRCELDACLFKKWVEDPGDDDKSKWKVNSEGKKARRGSWIYMLVYVDNNLVASAETYAMDATGKFLESVYQGTDLGWPKGFLGFELHRQLPSPRHQAVSCLGLPRGLGGLGA